MSRIEWSKHWFHNISKLYKDNNKMINWYNLSQNRNITIELILSTITSKENNWNWYQLTKNNSILKEEIILYDNLPWDVVALAERKSIYDDTYDKYYYEMLIELNQPFDKLLFCDKESLRWDFVSMNSTIRFNDIRNNINENWNWNSICCNEFDMEKEAFIRMKECKNVLINNSNLPFEMIDLITSYI